jgi:hypothetical protein
MRYGFFNHGGQCPVWRRAAISQVDRSIIQPSESMVKTGHFSSPRDVQ